MVVPVLVRGHDGVQAAAPLSDQRQNPCRVIRGVDEQLRTWAHAGQQIDVVRHRADAGLAYGQQGQIPLGAGAADGHVAPVLHTAPLVNGHNSPESVSYTHLTLPTIYSV